MRIRTALRELVFSVPLLRRLYTKYRTVQNWDKYSHLGENYFDEEPESIELFNGNTMFVYATDEKGDQYRRNDVQENQLNRLWNWYLTNSKVALDIGANYGQFLLFPDLKKRRKDLKIFAFEANPKIAKALEKSISANPELSKLVSLVPCALGDEAGRIELEINLVSSGSSSVIPGETVNPHRGQFIKKVEVPIQRLDSQVEELGVSTDGPVAIKIDVEGADIDVLYGGREFIAGLRQTLIVAETRRQIVAKLSPEKVTFVRELFEKFNSYAFHTNSFKKLETYEDYVAEFDLATGCIDIVFCDEEIEMSGIKMSGND